MKNNEVKMMLLGESEVGKTTLICKQKGNDTKCSNPTIGVHLEYIDFQTPNGEIKSIIFDTAGQERFRSLLPKSHFRDVDVFIIVFDLTKYETFDNLHVWLNCIKQNCNKEWNVILIGNKSDLEIIVKQDDIDKFCLINEIKYFQVSALNYINVKESFQFAARIGEEIKKKKNEESNIKIYKKPQDISNSCCFK